MRRQTTCEPAFSDEVGEVVLEGGAAFSGEGDHFSDGEATVVEGGIEDLNREFAEVGQGDFSNS